MESRAGFTTQPKRQGGTPCGESRLYNMSHPSFAYVFERFPSFVQTFCLREVQEMIRQGMEPLIYSIRPPEECATTVFPPDIMRRVKFLPPDDELRRQVRALREEHKLSSVIWNQFQSWGDKGDKTRLYEAAWIGEQLREQGVRHVHVHFAGIAARAAFWMKKFFGISYSFTGHANDLFCETNFPVSLADLVTESRFVATVSDFSRRWLAQNFPLQAAKFHRVYNGIEVGKFRHGTPAQPPVILSVGRYIEKKGFGDLIDACRLLHGRGADFRCLIVGTGPLEEELRARVSAAVLDGKVEITGPRSEEEVAALLATATIFALACTTDAEGGMDNLPTVIMEAMAASQPIVSTPVAGVPEMIEEGASGIMVPERDAAALAVALEKLLPDREGAARLGECGRRLATERFAVGVTARQLKRLLLRKGRARLRAGAIAKDLVTLPDRLLRLCGC
jgi:colanic acid/amylovoran biosynthesis glycosyltransferase